MPQSRRFRRLVVAIVGVVGAAVLAAACGGGDTDGAASGSESQDASASPDAWPHDFQAELIGGGTFDAGDYEGQDLVLWFWAPW
ncbi:MAG: hypothetical protein R8F63_04740 [Acidimicrobiales bacterium]|nr:hypothetical protein [Acidimicrobiales bacterium]